MLSLTGCSQTKKTVSKPDSETSSQVIHSKRNAGLVVTKNNKTNSNTDSNSEDDNQDQQSSSTVTVTHKQSNDDSTDNDAETTQKIPGNSCPITAGILKRANNCPSKTVVKRIKISCPPFLVLTLVIVKLAN